MPCHLKNVLRGLVLLVSGFPFHLVPIILEELQSFSSGVDWVQSVLFCSAPLAPSLVLRHVFFGFAPDELSAVPRVFVYLLHVLKYLLWNQRNDYRFRSSRPSAVALIAGGLVDVDAFLFVNGVVMGSPVPLGVRVSFSICDVVAPKYVPLFFLRLQVFFVAFVV